MLSPKTTEKDIKNKAKNSSKIVIKQLKNMAKSETNRQKMKLFAATIDSRFFAENTEFSTRIFVEKSGKSQKTPLCRQKGKIWQKRTVD